MTPVRPVAFAPCFQKTPSLLLGKGLFFLPGHCSLPFFCCRIDEYFFWKSPLSLSLPLKKIAQPAFSKALPTCGQKLIPPERILSLTGKAPEANLSSRVLVAQMDRATAS